MFLCMLCIDVYLLSLLSDIFHSHSSSSPKEMNSSIKFSFLYFIQAGVAKYIVSVLISLFLHHANIYQHYKSNIFKEMIFSILIIFR